MAAHLAWTHLVAAIWHLEIRPALTSCVLRLAWRLGLRARILHSIHPPLGARHTPPGRYTGAQENQI
jgi:hypothetical protein